MKGITQPTKKHWKTLEGVFVESAFNMRCHIVKNTLLHIAFSAILLAGKVKKQLPLHQKVIVNLQLLVTPSFGIILYK